MYLFIYFLIYVFKSDIYMCVFVCVYIYISELLWVLHEEIWIIYAKKSINYLNRANRFYIGS